jgi:hypothetical protein
LGEKPGELGLVGALGHEAPLHEGVVNVHDAIAPGWSVGVGCAPGRRKSAGRPRRDTSAARERRQGRGRYSFCLAT